MTTAVLLADALDLSAAAQRLSDPNGSFGRWCVPNLLPSVGLSVIYGQTGTMKTFLMVRAAIAIAAGVKWDGQTVLRGAVLYLASEDPDGVRARALACADYHGLQRDRLPLYIAPIHRTVQHGNFADDVISVARTISQKVDVPVRAVFLDTLGGAFGGASQDDAGPMTIATDRLLKMSEALKCGVAVAHHTGKDNRAMRGSQVLHDRADVVVRLTARGGKHVARLEKWRNGPADVTFGFTPILHGLDLGNRVIETLVVDDVASAGVRPADKSARARPLAGDSQICLDALRKLAPDSDDAIDLEIWRADIYAALGDRTMEAKRRAFNTARQHLTERGMIKVQNGTVSVSTA
jgi:DNA-binding MarR family transcriptional regulator